MSIPHQEPSLSPRAAARASRRYARQGKNALKGAYTKAAKEAKGMDPAVLETVGRSTLTKADLTMLAKVQVAGKFNGDYRNLGQLLNDRAAERAQQFAARPARGLIGNIKAGISRWQDAKRGKKLLKAAYAQAAKDAKRMDPTVREAIGRSQMSKSDLQSLAQSKMDELFRPEGQFNNVPQPQLHQPQNQILSDVAQLQAQVQQLQEQLQQLQEQNAQLRAQIQQQTQNQQQPQNQTQNQAQQPQPAQPQPEGQTPAKPQEQGSPQPAAQQPPDPAINGNWTRRFNGEAQPRVDSAARPGVDDRAASNQPGEQDIDTEQPAAEERVSAAERSPAELHSVTQSPSAGQPGYNREAAAANERATTGVEVGQHSGMNAADKEAQAVDTKYRALAGTTDIKFSSGEKAGADGQSNGERPGARIHAIGAKRGGKEI